MTNYDELKAAISRWLNRDDLNVDIPLFIQFAEASFNRRLRTMDQETRAYTSISEYIALPDDFLAMRNLQLNTSPVRLLVYMPPEGLDAKFAAGITGEPMAYTITDGQIQIGPTPSSTADVEIIYYARIPPLATNGTNWLLTKYPDVYLFGSLIHAEGRIGNDPRIATWKALLDVATREIDDADRLGKWTGAAMTMVTA